MDQLISILSRYDRKKKYYWLKNGSFVDLGDEGIRTLAQLKQELMIADSAMEDGVVSLPRYRAMYLGRQPEGRQRPVPAEGKKLPARWCGI